MFIIKPQWKQNYKEWAVFWRLVYFLIPFFNPCTCIQHIVQVFKNCVSLSIRRCLSKQHTLLLFSPLQVHFRFPLPKRAQTLQALNHVTIIPAKGNWRALPWVPINTCYLISQRGCWWLMAYSSIHPSSLLPQRLYHHCSHLSLGSESNRDWATWRVGEIHTIVQKLEFVSSKFPVINLPTMNMQLWNVLAENL